MKSMLLSVLFVFSTQVSHAHAEISDQMQIMGEQFTIIANALQIGLVTDSELEAAETLQVAIDESAQFLPHAATTEELQTQYIEMIGQLAQLAQDLRDQIELQIPNNPQDLQDAIATFVEMGNLRRQAHAIFITD